MRKNKFIKSAVLLMALTLCLSGCKKNNDNPVGSTEATIAIVETQAETTSEANPAEEQPVLEKEGMVRSILTGEWVDAEVGSRRPLAIMINNIEDADPQSGIDRAEVIYEAYVESSITRLMMVLQDYDDMDKIGPVRSCREFYVYFAKEFDAIYIHFGFSPLAAALLDSPEVEHLDGMKGWCSFYRTTDRVAPHNAYTTTKGILGSIESKGWETTLSDDFDQPLKFTQYDVKQIELENGENCTVFRPGFTRNKPVFTYNESDGLYYREQYGHPHVDMESGTQLAFKNILVKFVTGTKYENGTPILDLCGKGPAYYITNGKLIQVQWEKESDFAPNKFYYMDGTEVELNQGKTFINIITMDDLDDVSYE
ncbi:MAG: DUF3048 domain-containing protein [Lachnospiraceae bacterium]